MTAEVGRSLPAMPTHPEIHVEKKRILGLVKKIGDVIEKVWHIIWERGSLKFQIATFIFFRIANQFLPFGSQLEGLWGHVTTVYERIRASLREDQLLGEITHLRERNKAQDARIQQLAAQNHVLRLSHDLLASENKQVVEERDRSHTDVAQLHLAQAPVLIERDHLRQEKQKLSQQLQALSQQIDRLTQELTQALAAKKVKEKEHFQALKELDQTRTKLQLAGDYQQLNTTLERFQDAYLKLPQKGNRNATQLALGTLIPEYKSHREKLHTMLQSVIDGLPENDLARIPLEGILRVSKEEMEHVEKISRTLHLLEDLRQPLTQYFATCRTLVEVGGI